MSKCFRFRYFFVSFTHDKYSAILVLETVVVLVLVDLLTNVIKLYRFTFLQQ